MIKKKEMNLTNLMKETIIEMMWMGYSFSLVGIIFIALPVILTEDPFFYSAYFMFIYITYKDWNKKRNERKGKTGRFNLILTDKTKFTEKKK